MPFHVFPARSSSGGGGGAGGPPSTTYGVIDPRWPRHGSIGLVGDAVQALGMSGLSSFGSSTVIYPSPSNPLAPTSVLAATPRVYREQNAGLACGCGEELANGQSLRARDGYHLVWLLGGLASGIGIDDFAGFGALSAIAVSDLAGVPGNAMLGVSDTVLATPVGALDLVVTADGGGRASRRILSRPDGLLIFEVYARPNPSGPCNYMHLRLYDAEARVQLGEGLTLTNPAAIPQGFVSPFGLANRGGSGTSSFHCAGVFYGAGLAGPP